MKKTLLTLALLSSFSTITFANQAGDFMIRGGLTNVNPDSSKAAVVVDGADSGLKASVEDNTQLGLNFVYFYSDNWAVELLAATPFKHDITLYSDAGESKLADTYQLPPTLSALYYFDTNSAVKPYVGVGLNYTIFFDDSFTKTYKNAGFSDLDLSGSFGYALQVGADYQLDKHWSLNTSVRYIDISTDADFKVGGSTKGTVTVDVDPIVFSLMVGYTF